MRVHIVHSNMNDSNLINARLSAFRTILIFLLTLDSLFLLLYVSSSFLIDRLRKT
jgi:hypothetical protein